MLKIVSLHLHAVHVSFSASKFRSAALGNFTNLGFQVLQQTKRDTFTSFKRPKWPIKSKQSIHIKIVSFFRIENQNKFNYIKSE